MFTKEKLTVGEKEIAITDAMNTIVLHAMKGDMQAWKMIRDALDGPMAHKLELYGNVNISGPGFKNYADSKKRLESIEGQMKKIRFLHSLSKEEHLEISAQKQYKEKTIKYEAYLVKNEICLTCLEKSLKCKCKK